MILYRTRAISTILDQGLVTLPSGVLMLSVAATASTTTIGYAAMAYTLVGIVVMFFRQIVLFPRTLRSRVEVPHLLQVSKLVNVGTLLLVAAILFAVWRPETDLSGSPFGVAFLILLAIPLVLIFEVIRYFLNMSNAGTLSAFLSGVWALSSILIYIMTISGKLSLEGIFMSWFLVSGVIVTGAVASGSTLMKYQSQHRPHLDSQRVDGSTKRLHFVALALGPQAAALVTMVVVIAYQGYETWGVITVLALALYPLGLLIQSLPLLVRSSLVPLSQKRPAKQNWPGFVLMCVVALLWVFTLAWSPASNFESFFGKLWAESQDFVIPAFFAYLALGALSFYTIRSHWLGQDALALRVVSFANLGKVLLIIPGVVATVPLVAIYWIYLSESIASITAAIFLRASSRRGPKSAGV